MIQISHAGVTPVQKALRKEAYPTACFTSTPQLPLVPSRSQGALDLWDLERELLREPMVAAEYKGAHTHPSQCYHDVNQNPSYPVQQRCNQMGYLYDLDHRLSSQSGRDDTGPFMNSLPLPKTRYANQYPGPQYQQCATVVCQESPGSSYQHPLGCYQPTFSSTFQPSSHQQLHGHRFQQMPMSNASPQQQSDNSGTPYLHAQRRLPPK